MGKDLLRKSTVEPKEESRTLGLEVFWKMEVLGGVDQSEECLAAWENLRLGESRF